jgi:lipid-A-disaccharide synthase
MSLDVGRILMVAGEASGDLYGSLLANALREGHPRLGFQGIGGPRMKAAGVDLFADSRDLAVVGLTEVLSHWRPIRAAYRRAVSELRHASPDLLVLIDYPDFNLRLAREAKRHGVPVVYFIGPQIWAWRKSRLKAIGRDVSKMLVILPFEEAIYRDAGVPVEFVGHPLLDILPEPLTKAQARTALGISTAGKVVGLFPGSRRKELRAHLPTMLESAALLRRTTGDFRCLIPVASTLRSEDLAPILERSPLRPEPLLVEGKPWEAFGAMDAAVVKSGTATLEAALMGVPMVVVYRTSAVTYALARLLAQVQHVGLVNIVAGRRLVPERVQADFTASSVASLMAEYFANPGKTDSLRADLLALRGSLGEPGCFRRAAASILQVLQAGGSGTGAGYGA